MIQIPQTPGKCRVCGCTENHSCLVDGEPCAWLDADRTLCSNWRCVAQIPLDALLQMPISVSRSLSV